MKRSYGILRNKLNVYQQTKLKIQRKKTRFQDIGKSAEELTERQQQNSQLITSHSINSSGQQRTQCYEIYESAKEKLGQIKDIRDVEKQISIQSKARLTSFKERENEKYDGNIAKLASEATNKLVQAEKKLKQFKSLESSNPAEVKFVQNMEFSLAQEIREASRSLRQQQKQYFDRIRMYEKNTVNNAIELTAEQRVSMKNFMEDEMVEEISDSRNQNIEELVKSINKLSTIYKQLNHLVIEQGSLIDRIDVNIETTYEHTQKAVVHLEGADEAASSSFADSIIKGLVVMIILTALMLGFKYASS